MRIWLSALLLLVLAHSAHVLSAAEPAAVEFDSQIQPILASRCIKCHGSDAPESGLNLTNSASALSTLESGLQAIVPGDPEQSELLRRVTAEEGERMPPDGEPLSEQEVELLRQWIGAGATWPSHWAYRKLVKPALPELSEPQWADWCETPIDVFVVAKLQSQGLTPSAPAERRVLLRRLYFDLLGLPPTVEQLNAFLTDTAPDAYERVVDQLLASPHYGERWARHWMDLVHFAETHGHDQDRPRPHAWPYRDYLIRAFNSDTPYARFVQEQVAGDVLWPHDPWSIVATGFLAAGPWDESSLRDIREDSLDREVGRYLDRDDIVTTVMSTIVSTSAHCARCHDHKFDPISQEEYYSLQAVFAATDKANRAYDLDAEVTTRRNDLESWREKLPAMVSAADEALLRSPWEEERREWEAAAAAKAVQWHPLELVEAKSGGGAKLIEQQDGSILATGDRPDKDVYTVVLRSKLANITAVRLEVLPHMSLPMQGPGRQDNGNLHLNEVRVFALEANEARRPLSIARPQADFNQMGWTIAMAVDGNPNTAWGIHPAIGQRHMATLELAEPIAGTSDGVVLRLDLDQIHGAGHLIGCFRIMATDAATPLTPDGLDSENIAALLKTPPAERSKAQELQIAATFVRHKIEAELSKLPPPQMVYCGTSQFKADGSFRPTAEPRVVHVLNRGIITQPLREALPGALTCVEDLDAGPMFGHVDLRNEGERRAALARWLSDPRNALAWRSIANRVWQYHFGQGLVETANDFGQMGAAPTHPELLDWLTCTMKDNGGSLKELHRLIVTSAAYRQASQHRPDCAAVDADNRLLWRMNRLRLDAESFRDALLVLTGTLDPAMGGPSVRQFIETPGIHVTPNVDYLGFNPDDRANYRRSVYRFIFRTLPDPFMDAMDCPDASQLTPKRNVSVTALQAMATLHDKFVVRQSEHLAEKLERHTASPGEQVQLAYRWLFGRDPLPEEAEIVRQYCEEHGLANACRFLINTNEFLFVD